jgi:hypothetical protein
MPGERLSNQIPEDLVKKPKIPAHLRGGISVFSAECGAGLLSDGVTNGRPIEAIIGGVLGAGGAGGVCRLVARSERARTVLKEIRQALQQEGR